MEHIYSIEEMQTARRAHLVASSISLTRPVLAAVCAVETLVDAPPLVKVASNLATEISDAEGNIVRKWSNDNFERGEIKTTSDAITSLRESLHNDTNLKEWILSLNGSWLDERADKWAQNIRRAGLFLKGQLSTLNTTVPIVRDELVSNGRELYAAYGVEGVESAGKIGKAKTIAMGVGFLGKAAFGRKHHRATESIMTLGTTLSVVSMVDYFAKYEKAYQEQIWEETEPRSYGYYAFNGLAQAVEYTYTKRRSQLSSHLGKNDVVINLEQQSASDAA